MVREEGQDRRVDGALRALKFRSSLPPRLHIWKQNVVLGILGSPSKQEVSCVLSGDLVLLVTYDFMSFQVRCH